MGRGNDRRGTPEDDHLDRFDALPPRLKRLLQLAHTNYKVYFVEDWLKNGEHFAYQTLRDYLWRARRADILTYYGPSHPELAR